MTALPGNRGIGASRLARGLGPLGLLGSLLLHGAVLAALARLPLPAPPPLAAPQAVLTVELAFERPVEVPVTPSPTPAIPPPTDPLPEAAPAVVPLPSTAPRPDVPPPAPPRRKPTAPKPRPPTPTPTPTPTDATAPVPTVLPVGPPPDAIAAAPPAIDAEPPGPVSISAPRFRHRLPPVYPLQARRDELEGSVRLKLVIDPSGAVASVVVLRSSGHRVLDQAALAAAALWQLEPEQRNGIAVPAWAEVEVPFRLIE